MKIAAKKAAAQKEKNMTFEIAFDYVVQMHTTHAATSFFHTMALFAYAVKKYIILAESLLLGLVLGNKAPWFAY